MYGAGTPGTCWDPERERLLIALATLISFESWDQMRNCYGLSLEAAQEVWAIGD